MKLAEIEDILGLEELVAGDRELEIETACGADLMSDVLAFSQEKTLLLTGLTNPQVIRTAEMAELKVVIFVRGKRPPLETKKLAEKKGIALYLTGKSLFESCGLLFQQGLQPEALERIDYPDYSEKMG